MTDATGLFGGADTGTWVWRGNELFDGLGHQVASVRSDVLFHAGERMLLEYSPGGRFRLRATTAGGAVYTAAQRGLTVQHLHGSCEGRDYEMDRTSLWRKERVIRANSGPVALVRPRISGAVEIVDDPEEMSPLPAADAVFLSWACVMVDSPVRKTRT